MDDADSGELRKRGSLIDVQSYDVLVDLTAGSERFWSRTRLIFHCREEGASVFADLRPVMLRQATLNGIRLAGAIRNPGVRLELPRLARDNELVVEAEFAYAPDGRGLSRVTAGGLGGVYSKANNGGAARVFCCFDQPDLRAPITLTVHTPTRWWCRANFPTVSRSTDGGTGVWRFATTPPLAPYLFALCAGPPTGGPFWATRINSERPIRLTVCAPFTGGALVKSDDFADLIDQPLRYYENTLGVRFPYPKLDFVFVPGFPALAYSPPGLAMLQDRLLSPSPRQRELYLALVLAHELAHSWFGGIMDMRDERDGWLQEALATYVSRAALEHTQHGTAPWVPAVSESLPDHAYAKDGALLLQIEDVIGRPALLGGLAALMRTHPHGTVSIDDLARSWSVTSGRDVRRLTAEVLNPAGPAQEKETQ